MESTTAPSIQFKSKKPFLTTPKKEPSSVGPNVVTPDRSNPPLTRIRNRNFALSVSDIRRTALKLRESNGAGSGSGSDLQDPAHQKLLRSVVAKQKSSEKCVTLPEKYEMLCEFFNAVVSSIQLLRLKRSPSTFTKLCCNIESLTDRRFTLHHLAQLKHVLPEVIMVRKIRVQDEKTNCMKEDLFIMLEVDAVEVDENPKHVSGFSRLKGIFRSRITNYSANHPEGDDIPEEELPHLFYQPKQDPNPSITVAPTSLAASHMTPSFKRRFSSRALDAPVMESSSSPAKPSSSQLPETPVKEADCVKAEDGCSSPAIDIQGTPAKPASTPLRMMTETPVLRPPKRSLMSPDHDAGYLTHNSSKRSRSLKFDHPESGFDVEDQPTRDGDDEDKAAVQGSTASNDVLGVLPEDLLHSLIEKEKRISEERDPEVLQARKRQQLMGGLPKLFDMIRLIFQCMRRSVMTKEELIYKLLTGHLDVVDRREVEEQLKLLQEVAPEYISEQLCLSGDTLLRLNKSACAESIRAKLLQAK